MSDEFKLKIQGLAVYQIFGGIRGMWLGVALLVSKSTDSWSLFIAVPCLIFYTDIVYTVVFVFSQMPRKD